MTTWKVAPGHPHYEVSDDGRVRSNVNRTFVGQRFIVPTVGRLGHQSVKLHTDGVRHRIGVHRLVLLAFVGEPPEGKPWALHNDGDPTNNTLGNLRWGSPAENSLDSLAHGTHPLAARDSCSKGHEYTPENTRYRGGDRSQESRICRACVREQSARRRRAAA